jgi:mannitol/fructose-specific phosphotransferase system IIA component (Ntr-type)
MNLKPDGINSSYNNIKGTLEDLVSMSTDETVKDSLSSIKTPEELITFLQDNKTIVM